MNKLQSKEVVTRKTVMSDSADINNYEFTFFSYDLLDELIYLDEYPEELEKKPFFQIIVARKRRFPKTIQAHDKDGKIVEIEHPRSGENIPRKYHKLFYKYFNSRSKHIILDIIFAYVPIEIAIEESMLGEASESETIDYFTAKTIKKYRVKRDNLYEMYFDDSLLCCFPCDPSDYMDVFYDLILSKILALQPTVFLPDYGLRELMYDPKLFTDTEWPYAHEANINYLNNLNHIRKNLGDCTDAYSQFLTDSFLSIKDKLLKDKLISECLNCNDLFLYVDSKKYCYTGCRKKAESKRYYTKHQQKLKGYKREDTKALRAFYKEKGIKK